jgi:hypothetical protein
MEEKVAEGRMRCLGEVSNSIYIQAIASRSREIGI